MVAFRRFKDDNNGGGGNDRGDNDGGVGGLGGHAYEVIVWYLTKFSF